MDPFQHPLFLEHMLRAMVEEFAASRRTNNSDSDNDEDDVHREDVHREDVHREDDDENSDENSDDDDDDEQPSLDEDNDTEEVDDEDDEQEYEDDELFLDEEDLLMDYDDDEDEEEDDDEQEDDDEDEEEEDDDDDDSVIDSGESFIEVCIRIAQNDATLVHLDNWCCEGVSCSRQWQVSDLILLGKSLLHNTHLDSLNVIMDSCCICDEEHSDRGGEAVRYGVAKAELRHLTLTSVCGTILTSFFKGVKMSTTLQHLDVRDTMFMYNIFYLHNLLAIGEPPLVKQPWPLSTTLPMSTTLSSTLSTSLRPDDSCLRLTHLSLRNCKLENMDLMSVTLGIAKHPTLISFNVEKNLITNVGVMYFCQNWNEDSPLQELDLSWNKIGSKGALFVLEATKQHSAMRKLLLTGNTQIGHEGLLQIGQQLPHILGLHTLTIHKCSNLPSTESILAAWWLAKGLRGNTSLGELDIGANNFGAAGSKLLLQAVAKHPTLQSLSMAFDASIGLVGLRYIGNELASTKLKRLCLDAVVHPWPSSYKHNKAAFHAGQALLTGVQNNIHMTDFAFFGLDERWMKPIQFYADYLSTLVPRRCLDASDLARHFGTLLPQRQD